MLESSFKKFLQSLDSLEEKCEEIGLKIFAQGVDIFVLWTFLILSAVSIQSVRQQSQLREVNRLPRKTKDAKFMYPENVEGKMLCVTAKGWKYLLIC